MEKPRRGAEESDQFAKALKDSAACRGGGGVVEPNYGHTYRPQEYNLGLSERLACTPAVSYLASEGIDQSLLVAKGFKTKSRVSPILTARRIGVSKRTSANDGANAPRSSQIEAPPAIGGPRRRRT